MDKKEAYEIVLKDLESDENGEIVRQILAERSE